MKRRHASITPVALAASTLFFACGSAPTNVPTEDVGTLGSTPEALNAIVQRVGLQPAGDDAYALDDMVFSKDRVVATFGQDGQALTQAAGALWPVEQRYDLKYCVSTAFDGDHDRIVTAMRQATEAWTLEAGAGLAFYYAPGEDGNCTDANPNVNIDIVPGGHSDTALANSTVGPFASANHSHINVFDSGRRLADEASTGLDLKGTMTHELGHTLGFYHEHDNPAARGCGNGKWDGTHVSLTPYDPPSVMHYIHDQDDKCPSTNYQAITEQDKRGAQLAYPRTPVVAFRNVATGQCLTVSGAATGAGATVDVEACSGADAQQFRVVNGANGTQILAAATGLAVGDLRGGTSTFPVTMAGSSPGLGLTSWTVAAPAGGAHLALQAPNGKCLSSAGEVACNANAADQGWQEVLQSFVPRETNYHRTYGRGVGVPVSTCPAGMEKQGALCYPTCAPGYYGVGPVCWQSCPAGYADDGATCRLDPSTISADNGSCPWYDACGLTFARGCSWCPDGYANNGCTCYRDGNIFGKSSYGRGAGTPLNCGSQQYDSGLCYDACSLGFHGVGPLCWEDDHAALPGGSVPLLASANNLVLAVEGSNNALGTRILAWPWQGTSNETFRLTPTGDGDYFVQSTIGNECLAVWGGSPDSGAKVVLWSCDGTPNERFTATALGSDKWYLAAKQSNRCLSIPAGRAAGAPIDQEDCGLVTSQQLTIH